MSGSARRIRIIASWIVAAVVLFAMPALQRTFDFAVFNLIFLYFIFFWVTQATSWNIFSGYSGYFSFGQGAFYGAGLYVTGNLVARYGTSLLPALPLGAIVGAGIAALTGVVVFRLRRLSGEIFALFTLAVALSLGSLANTWSFIDGGRGIPIGVTEYPSFLGSTTEMLYYLGLALALGAVIFAALVQNSRLGYGLFTIRDDERVAEAIGVPTFRYKLLIFTVNGAIAGLSGALHAVQVNFISPATAFNLTVPLFVILMSVVGGRRHWSGPVLGAVLIHTVTDRLTGAGLAEASQILLAVLLILSTLFLRGGIAARLLQRPLPPVIVGLAILVGLTIFGDGPVISQAAIAMLGAMAVLFIPERAYAALPGRTVASVSHEATDAGAVPPQEPPVARASTERQSGPPR